MVEATIEDLAITIRFSRETIWGYPHIVGEDVLSTTKIFTGAKPFLKANIKPFGITEIEMLTVNKFNLCKFDISGKIEFDMNAWIPEIVGDWWQIAGNPDLGRYQTDRQQPLDFGIWQAADGTWQLWSCVRYTGCGGKTRLFYRWEGERLTSKDWRPMGIAMEADPNLGETEGGLQAPYVLRKGDVFYMYYGDWVNICMAKSSDGKTFARHLNDDGLSGLFSEKPGTKSRDPMVMVYRELYYIYYTAVLEGKGAIYCRTSTDLVNWGDSVVVSSGGIGGDGPSAAECAFVYYMPHDYAFYFFRAYPVEGSEEYRTAIYRSQNPLDFGVDSDEYLVGSLPFEVVRIIKDGPDFYMTSLNPGYDGIRLAKMKWVPASAK